MVDTPRTKSAIMALLADNTDRLIGAQDLRDGFESLYTRTPVSVREFGAKGDGANDDTAAIQAALDTGGPVYMPPGTYRTTTTLNITLTGTRLTGAGCFGQTRIAPANATANVIRVTAQQVVIEHLEIQPLQVQTGGFAVVFDEGCFLGALDSVRVNFGYNGILLRGATETRLRTVGLRYMYGAVGVQFTGTVTANGYRAIIDDIICDNPYPVELGTVRGAWAASTAYTVGQVVTRAGMVYQCTQSGTSGTSGPSGFSTGFFSDITDGGARWRFVSNALSWIVFDSYAYSLVVNKAALLNATRGLLMTDSANTGTSYPIWLLAFDVETDHPLQSGMEFDRGEGVYSTTGWHGSSLANNGITIGANFRGEVSITNSRLMGNTQHGMLISAGPVDTLVTGCMIGDNLGNGITVATNATRFTVVGNRIGDLVGISGSSQQYGISIASGCNNFVVVGNQMQGNLTASIGDATSGATKSVANNL